MRCDEDDGSRFNDQDSLTPNSKSRHPRAAYTLNFSSNFKFVRRNSEKVIGCNKYLTFGNPQWLLTLKSCRRLIIRPQKFGL